MSKLNIKIGEHEALSKDREYNALGDSNIRRISENEIEVDFGNGYFRIVSETPMKIFCNPESIL